MQRAAASRRPRRFARLWHRWFGLIAGVWLILLAVTGSAIAFYDEIDRGLNPDWRTVSGPAGPPIPLDRAVALAQAALPGFAPGMIQLPGYTGDTLWLLGRAPLAQGQKPRPVQLFLDPRDGTVLGWRESGRPALDRRHFADLIYGLHIDLLAGPWVTWCFGLIALLWVIDHAVAVGLAFPRGGRARRAFAVAGRRGSLRRLFDLHRAPGLWLAPVTLTLAVTGLTLAWPDDSRAAVGTLSPMTARLHETMPQMAEPLPAVVPGIDAAVARVLADRPGARVHSIRPLPDHAVHAIRTFDPRDRDDQGRLWTYVAMADGRIVGRRHDNGTTAADQFFAWQYPLHSGKAFGLAGRILIALAGLVTAALAVTGFALWWRRRRRAV